MAFDSGTSRERPLDDFAPPQSASALPRCSPQDAHRFALRNAGSVTASMRSPVKGSISIVMAASSAWWRSEATGLLTLVAQQFPEHPPAATVVRWAADLQETSDFGTAILDADFPTTAEIASEDQPEILLAAFRCFFEAGAFRARSARSGRQRSHDCARPSSIRACVPCCSVETRATRRGMAGRRAS